MQHIKCVVVGDACADKKALLLAYTTNAFPDEDIPTIFDNYSANVIIDDEQINLQLWDTDNQTDKLRALSYPQTDVFVVCFSLVSPASLEHVQSVWIPEIKEHCPNTPYILVGGMSSFRDGFAEHEDEYKAKGWEPIPSQKGEEMKKQIGAEKYIEYDAKMQYNLKEILQSAIRMVLAQRRTANIVSNNESGGCQLF